MISLQEELLTRLRGALRAANYTTTAVGLLLGESADAARLRGVLTPARRILANRPESALATLVQMFVIGDVLEEELVDRTLEGVTASDLVRLGLLRSCAEGGVKAALSLNAVSISDCTSDTPINWWIVSDLDDHLRHAPAASDHVMGVGGATKTLISQIGPTQVSSSLDLGTGCGIVALHLSRRGPVVATDISERALEIARVNAYLNECAERIEFRKGDLFAPVASETFELIVSNPPFVVTPRNADGVPRYEYRDGGMVGDGLAEAVVAGMAALLAPRGEAICLANWESPWGENGLQRVGEWVKRAATSSDHALAVWVVERDRLTPELYAETWVRDGGTRPGTVEFEELLASWLDDFAVRRITAIGLGSVRMRRLPDELSQESLVRLEHASERYTADSLGERLSEVFAEGIKASQLTEAQFLDARWIRDDSVLEVREHVPGVDAPSAIKLELSSPMVRTVAADPLLAAAIGVCDGELTLRQISGALAELLELDEEACDDALVTGLRELVWLGALALFAE